jgi:hypothetical protein
MSTSRRSLHLALPDSDPRSASIWAWLDAQPAGVDRSALIRQAIVTGLEVGAALARIEARLDGLTMGSPPPRQPSPPDPEADAALDTLLRGFD